MYFWGDGMVVGIDEKFLFREKMGVPLLIFFKIWGVHLVHLIAKFFGGGRPLIFEFKNTKNFSKLLK